MISIEQTKKLLKRDSMSDAEAEEIQNGFHFLAEIIFDAWMEERRSGNLRPNEGRSSGVTTPAVDTE